MEKKYWKSLQEAGAPQMAPAVNKPTEISTGLLDVLSNDLDEKSSSRRDFLKWCGISFVSATVVSACENPVKKAIPYIIQPEELIPGKATWYASTYLQGNDYCSILVKTRDGRPIKIEGNELCNVTGGGTTAKVQASVLGLYDDGARYKHPMKEGKKIAWEAADAEIQEQLDQIQSNNGRMVLVTPTLISPSTKLLVKDFMQRYPSLEVVTRDAISYSAIRKAYLATHNSDVIPDYRFDKAEMIVSFSADFLGTWLAPAVFAGRYSKTRTLDEKNPSMSHHVQFEANLSLTGSNADERIPVKPGEEIKILLALYNALESTSAKAGSVDYDVQALAANLKQRSGKCLVVSGHNNLQIQTLINAINQKLNSYGNTIDLNTTIRAGNDDEKQFGQFVSDLNAGKIEAVMFYQSNPVYDYFDAEKIAAGIKKAKLSISYACAKDETAEACTYILPDNHYLESWNDAAFLTGHYSLAQPAIRKIFNTRQFQDTLLAWMGNDDGFYQYLKNYWESEIFPMQSRHPGFTVFWKNTLQAGALEIPSQNKPAPVFEGNQIAVAVNALAQKAKSAPDTEFSLIQNISIGDGANANNPWLQEMPDPMTSVAWDNFAAVSPRDAEEKGLKTGDIIQLNDKLVIPVIVQPGQAYRCISIALGYGRTKAGKAGNHVGVNVYPMISMNGDHQALTGAVAVLEKTGKKHQFAMTQMHFDMEGRAIVRESTLDKYKNDRGAGNELHKYHKKYKTTLYPETVFEGHHWALMVDLNACTGCSNCVIACQSENNVPVVGKDEVRRRRIMHWMRIDRYYNGGPENPEVVFQPVMCQHCDHAPCENVCPVAATTHSSEGINQMAYNRCVGTKYCINNCPYKVRRFNWFRYAQNQQFDYNMNSDLGRMVLNPDVTVRERGVVEKCSFCVQRIQQAKLKAKNERRPLRDGEIIPACVQSCPSKALVFGDLNDKNSRVSKMIKDPRNYHLIEELHTLPSVGYLTKIRNKKA
jgi:Fe-S-cluster-containing dehydrogenase component/anaerobic selenocysteine-containing dehydrogenase